MERVPVPKSVSVIGAGMVGISCALELQRRGYQVTLIDRRGIGEETSSGNAGLLSYSNITPIACPQLLPRMLHLLLNRDADFLLHYPHLPGLTPWLLRFLPRCNRRTFFKDGEAMSRITQPSIDIHRKWIAEAGVEHLANSSGGLKLYRDRATFLRDQLERDLMSEHGVKYTQVNEDEVYQLEPDLHRIFNCGVLINDTVSIRNPNKLCQAYAQMFIDAGGEFKQSEVESLEVSGDGWLLGGEQAEEVERVVVCLGAWTPSLIGQLGYANPLAHERGYHTIFAPLENQQLTRPIFDVNGSYVMTPMDMGLRVTSGTNLVHRETEPNPKQLDRIIPRVHEAFPIGQKLLKEPWMGRRPTVPDTLPLIGPAPRHKNLWLAFGHAHMGLTQGPISGQLIANFIDGSEQPFPIGMCDPARHL
jgi:D-amino-acid dehydrogenase